MGREVKPRTADGYTPDVTQACERTLLTLLSAFGNLKHTLRLVGGLVPRYLTPEAPPDVPVHAGTSDVDVVLNIQVLAEGDEYASLADQLNARGFERFLNAGGVAVSWRWRRQVDKHLDVVVELLRDAGEGIPGRVESVIGERVSALNIRYAGIVHDWYLEREVTAHLLDAKGVSTETIRFADVPAFVILKALALDQRQENKDAADLIHVIRYAGSLDHVADLFIRRIISGDHVDAMTEGIAALRRRFCDDIHSKGFEKLGAVAHANFHYNGDDDDRVREQRFSAALIENLLGNIDRKLKLRKPR
jgi:hypothetical protein